MTFQELVRQANSNSFFEPDRSTVHKQPKSKQHKLVSAASELSADQLELLRELASGARALVRCAGDAYACKRTPYGWTLRALHAGARDHNVNVDCSACSCEDHTFRKRTCKHMEGLLCLSQGS